MLVAIIGPEEIRKMTLQNGLVSELALCGFSVGMARCEIVDYVDAQEWISWNRHETVLTRRPPPEATLTIPPRLVTSESERLGAYE